jgi:hypothetical protein
MTRPPLHIDELVEHWTILDEERDLIAGKRGATRLAFGILLKFYTQHGRFPRGRYELPDEAVEYVAKQVKVPASELGLYEWSGSTIEYHRSQIRKHLGFRTCSTADATKVAVWLAENVAHAERRPERVREELLKHLREEKVEPPTPGRVSRIVGSALRQSEAAWSLRIVSRLTRWSGSAPWQTSPSRTRRTRWAAPRVRRRSTSTLQRLSRTAASKTTMRRTSPCSRSLSRRRAM